MQLSGFSEWFSKARNRFAYQGGAKVDLPWLPFATLTAQYSKIEPFVYTHIPTWNSTTRLKVNINYTNDGENLGYYLPPNSDELLLRLDAMVAPGWRTSLQYSLVRHGDNSDSAYTNGDYLVYGDIDKYQISGSIASLSKNFLHDGIYDWNHIGKVNFFWRPAEAPKLFGLSVPVELGLGYGLSYTWYVDGTGGGAAVAAPEWKNVLELSVKLSY
jgi:hypothetical protein